jgi:hypothetical protein
MIHVSDPQVINGQQTIRTLSADLRRGRLTSVPVRVIKLRRQYFPGRKFETLVNQIVVATNWQNPIDPVDIHANDERQVRLAQELEVRRYHYARKEMSKEERAGSYERGVRIVKMVELAYAVAVCEIAPDLPVRPQVGKAGLFGEDYYNRVFPSREGPDFYLKRYWVSQLLRSQAGRSGGLTYAKWLGTNFLWGRLRTYSDPPRTASFYEMFRSRRGALSAKPMGTARTLGYAARVVLESCMAYYRHSAQHEANRNLSPAAFFKREALGAAFGRYWESAPNARRRSRYNHIMARFERQFAAMLTSESV